MESNSPKLRGEEQTSLIKAWKERKIAKTIIKTQKKLHEISTWENTKASKIESELAKLKRKTSKKAEKLRNEKLAVHKEAQEKKAEVQTKRAQEILDAEEKAAKFQATGQSPPKKSSFCCL